jgi:D-psicose/D-tagatose/L-ribulose 3-epimerase
MRIAISNIAWPIEREEEIADLLGQYGIAGVEVAPTKMWPRLAEATPRQIQSYRETWNKRGIEIPALQSLLFGRPDLTLFESLQKVIAIAAGFGAKILVFGSPKNRLVGALEKPLAAAVARDFFMRLGDLALAAGVRIGIEANPTSYGADFLTSAAESIRLIEELNHPGVCLHLCSGMALAGDNPEEWIRAGAPRLGHFHLSAPFLNHIDHPAIDHPAIAAALRTVAYRGWVSIEMKTEDPFSVPRIETALALARLHYAGD